jgi:hypothetical protein
VGGRMRRRPHVGATSRFALRTRPSEPAPRPPPRPSPAGRGEGVQGGRRRLPSWGWSWWSRRGRAPPEPRPVPGPRGVAAPKSGAGATCRLIKGLVAVFLRLPKVDAHRDSDVAAPPVAFAQQVKIRSFSSLPCALSCRCVELCRFCRGLRAAHRPASPTVGRREETNVVRSRATAHVGISSK